MAHRKSSSGEESVSSTSRSRRGFLRTVGGVATGATLFTSGCDSTGTGSIPGRGSPTASFTAEPVQEGGLEIQFDAGASEDPDGNIARYSWDFDGPGQRAENDPEQPAPTAIYTYDRPGIYQVRLVVADRNGQVGRTTQEVTVGTVDPGEGPVPLDLNTDLGVLNYAYALEQLEAAFYTQVLDEGTFSGEEATLVNDLAAHEDIHRLSIQSILQTAAIRDLTPTFGDVNFGSRTDVLETAQTLEALGVAAYNGAADLFSSETFLAAAGSIVSVEARHAAVVRELSDPMGNLFGGELPGGWGFAIDDNGLYQAREPREVLGVVEGSFVEESFEVQGG